MPWRLDKTTDGRLALIVSYSSLNDWTDQISTALASLGIKANQVAVTFCVPTSSVRGPGHITNKNPNDGNDPAAR